MDALKETSPIIQALLATCFTWGMTALGAASVFMVRTFNQKIMDTMLGFAAGVMVAASYWSLLAPGIDLADDQGMIPWVPAVIGFLLGGIALRGVDYVLPHQHPQNGTVEGISTTWRRSILLVLAITLHNFPEGLAVGVAFGAVELGLETATLGGAVSLAIGIGLQNLPEGIAVAMPLQREQISHLKAFWYGQLSAVVEPIAGVLGAALVVIARPLLPYALSFAAGAMIFVVVEEVIPGAECEGHQHLATTGFMLGFAVMMTLDVALG